MKPLRTIKIIAGIAAVLFTIFLLSGVAMWMQTQRDLDRVYRNVSTINRLRVVLETFETMEVDIPELMAGENLLEAKLTWDSLYIDYIKLVNLAGISQPEHGHFAQLVDSCFQQIHDADQRIKEVVYKNSKQSAVGDWLPQSLAAARGHIIDAIQQVRYDQAVISFGLANRWNYVLSLFVFGAIVGFSTALSCTILANKLRGARQKGEDWLRTGQHFQRLFDESGVGILLLDLKSLKILQANRAFCGIIGHSEEMLKSMDLQQICSQDCYDHEVNLLDKILDSRISSSQAETRLIHGNGKEIHASVTSTILLDERSEPESVLMIIQDTSQSRAAERERQRSEKRYRLIADNSSDMIVKLDSRGKILYVSPACQTVLGVSASELSFLKFCDFVHPDDRRIVRQAAKKILNEQIVDSVRYRARRSSGAYIWVETTARAIDIGDDDNEQQLITVTRDISQRKQYEEALEKAHLEEERRVEDRTRELRLANIALERENRVREETEKMLKATLSERELLLKEIFHRVKNNMQVVSSMLKLQSRQIDHPETSRILEESQRRIECMSLIHESLYQQEHLSDVDFHTYVSKLVTHLLKTYSSYRDPRVEIEVGFQQIQVDMETAIPCGLIIHELVSNALKHAFEADLQQDRRIFIDFTRQDAGYQLIVSDNGKGISQSEGFQEKSFGLRLVELLVRQLNGKQSVSSDAGTTIVIDIKESAYKDRVHHVQ